MRRFYSLLLFVLIIGSMPSIAQIHINAGSKYYHLSGGNEYYTGTFELEVVNNIGTGFGATVQYGKDFLAFDPISLVCGLGLFINYAKMNKMIERIENERNCDRETAIQILHNNGTYREMMNSNKLTALGAMAGNTKFYIPIGGSNMFDTNFFIAPEFSLVRFIKLRDLKMDVCGSAGGRFLFVPTYHMTISAFGEYQWGYHRDSPYKGWAVGATLGYRL